MAWIQEGSGLTWGDFQDLRWRNTETGEVTYKEPAGYSQAVADNYYKYISQGFDPQTASALAHGEVHGFTDMQPGLSQLTPTSSSIASGINPETGQRETLGVSGMHDPRTSNERFNTAVLSVAGGALGGAALGGAGTGAGAGGTAAAEGAAAGGAAAGGTELGALGAGAGDMFGAGAAWEAGTAGLGAGELGLGGAAATGAAGAASAAGGSSGGNSVDSPAPTSGSNAGNVLGGTALGRIYDGTATAADWLNIGGNVAGAGLGYLGAERQGQRLDALARDYMALGAPSRARFESSFAPDFDVTKLPGFQQSMDTANESLLRKLSAKSGNPYGDPGGLAEIQKYIVGNLALPAISDYRRINAGAGGLAALTSAAPATAAGAINADAGRYDAIGGALADLTRPKRDIYDYMREMRSLA